MDVNIDQNKRIGKLEDRLNVVENNLSTITAKLDVINTLCRGLFLLASLALGLDVVPMMGEM
jgi:hypothetical protein